MSIKEATPEEIQAMKARLNQKWADRLCEAQMDEVVRMVQKHPFVAEQANQRPRTPPVESAIVTAGNLTIAGAAALLGNLGAIPMRNAVLIVAVAIFGAVMEVSKYVPV